MARNLISARAIVNDYLVGREQNDYDTANERVLFMYAKQAIRDELSQSLGASLKSVKLTVDTTLNVVQLPNDYISYTKIGVLDGNCQVQVLGMNDKINFAGTFQLDGEGAKIVDSDGIEQLNAKDCEPTAVGDVNPGIVFFHNYHLDAFNNGRLYGWGGGNNVRGYYRFNPMDNRIELDSRFNYDTIILEYIADESMSSDPQVAVEAEDYIRKYIYYRSIERKSNVPSVEKRSAKNEMSLAKKKAHFKYKMFNRSELIQKINKNFKLSPKFLYD